MTESETMLLDALEKQTQRFIELEKVLASDLKNIRLVTTNALKRQDERLSALEKLVSDMAESPNQLQNELERLRIEQEKTTEQLNRIIDGTNNCLSQLENG